MTLFLENPNRFLKKTFQKEFFAPISPEFS